MRIANLLLNPDYTDSNDWINNYYVVPDNYDFSGNSAYDVTSACTLQTFMQINQIEYGIFRTSLTSNVVPIWSGLSFSDKQLCVKYFCYPPGITTDEYWTYVDASTDYKNWRNLVMKCNGLPSVTGQRLQRVIEAFVYFTYNLTAAQVAPIYLTTKPYIIDYWLGNMPHLLLWITNGTYAPLGIDFSSHGFAQASGYSPTIEAGLINIIQNGIYPYS